MAGKALMRKDDHQMHFDMQALLVSEKAEQSYNIETKILICLMLM